MKKVQVLQLGAEDYSELRTVSDRAEWHYEPDFSELPQDRYDIFDLAILDREIGEDEFDCLLRFLRAYTLFVTEAVPVEKGSPLWRLMMSKKGKRLSPGELSALLEDGLADYFSGSYGEKFQPGH